MDIGDLVVLKVGGPIMAVSISPSPGLHNEQYVRCVWFNTRNEKQEGDFKKELLEPSGTMVCNACGTQFIAARSSLLKERPAVQGFCQDYHIRARRSR
jgi:uncharacterized protein YodC (DUF2158 family)